VRAEGREEAGGGIVGAVSETTPAAEASDEHGDGVAPPDGPVTVTVCPEGPYLVRGPMVLQAPDGTTIDPGRATFALCRCGRSGSAPFCDGSHKAGPRATPDRGRP